MDNISFRNISSTDVMDVIRQNAHSLTGAKADFDPIMEMVGDARFVLIGEASHGTHDFYATRAEITKRLIEEKGFTGVAVEADWPDAYRINRFVRGGGDGTTAISALEDFKRFPMWMWRNADVLNFVGWLREHNDALPKDKPKTGFYGLDLYSLYASMRAVLDYLDKVDPEAAQRARYRYSCFEAFGEEPQSYGYAASFGMSKTCEDEAVRQLVELQQQAAEYIKRDGIPAEDEQFFAEINARVVVDAEEYYRSMFRGRVSSWNLRDRHMVDTLDSLAKHLDKQVGQSKIVVWEHNSHLGDARATEMGSMGEWNVGQLVRERHGDEARLIGFTTYSGTVTAADDWDEPAKRKNVRPGLPGSYESLFHDTDIPNFLLVLRDNKQLSDKLRGPHLERAIGVIYRPDTERISHYFNTRLSEQFDAILHLDETHALEPLDITAEWERGEVPETYPFNV